MSLVSNISALDWFSLGPRLVGLVFIWTGAIKAVAPHTFSAHLVTLEWIPDRLLRVSVPIIAGLEVTWGVALLLAISPPVIFPLTIGLLVFLSFISWWGVKSGKATDCGCYGGFVQPSIVQSVGMNAGFALLVLAAWLTSHAIRPIHSWQLLIVTVSGLAAAVLSGYAQNYQRETGNLLFDTNPLKIGKRWRHQWVDNLTRGLTGEFLVTFMGPDCPYCAQWIRIGNAVSQSSQLPTVIGAVASTVDRRDSFARENAARFPIAIISQSLMGRLAQAVPTTVLVADGRIQKRWLGAAPPPEFVDRLKEAYFPMTSQERSASHTTTA